MKRFLILSACLAFLFSSSSSATNLDFIKAVKPLQRIDFITPDGEVIYKNTCTAVQINQIDHIWLTAAHCVLENTLTEEGYEITIGERFIGTQIMSVAAPVVVIEIDSEKDLAVLQASSFWYPFEANFGKKPKLGQEIFIAGHPFGYLGVFLTRGWISSLKADLGWSSPFMVFQVPAAPGSSGSPVFNTKGEVVSILQIGWSRDFSPMTAGALWEDVRVIAGKYFSQSE